MCFSLRKMGISFAAYFACCDYVKLRSLLSDARISKSAAMAQKKSWQPTWRTYLFGESAELFHLGYAMLNKFSDVSKL